MHERPARARSPHGGGLTLFGRVNSGSTSELIEPRYCRVRTLPMADKKRNGGAGMSSLCSQIPPPSTIFENSTAL